VDLKEDYLDACAIRSNSCLFLTDGELESLFDARINCSAKCSSIGLGLEIDGTTFSLKQFQDKREKVCKEKNTTITIASRGLVSLMLKGIILKEKNLYSNTNKLIPFMRLKAKCDYATAIHEVRIK
jgi:hypothetical protein